MFLTKNSGQNRNTLVWSGLVRISLSIATFLSLPFDSPTSRSGPEEAAVGALFLLWGMLTILWQKRGNNFSQKERFTAFMDLALCVVMMMVFHILPVNISPAAFFLPTLELSLLYGIAGAAFVIATFAWTTMLTGLISVSLIQQPLWWVLVLLWATLIIFTAALQMVHSHHLQHPPLFAHLQKELLPRSSKPVDLPKSEFFVEDAEDQFTLMAPQVAAALELPFQHMGVRTEDHRQEIEKAVNALYCMSDFDKEAFSNCLQQLLQAAKQNWTGLAAFSPREREILELLLQNISYKQMSSLLYVSTSTIKTHVYHIFQKLGISNREEAICLIRERGWFSIQESLDAPLADRSLRREHA